MKDTKEKTPGFAKWSTAITILVLAGSSLLNLRTYYREHDNKESLVKGYREIIDKKDELIKLQSETIMKRDCTIAQYNRVAGNCLGQLESCNQTLKRSQDNVKTLLAR